MTSQPNERVRPGGRRAHTLALMIGLVGGCCSAPAPPPPNFLLVTVDTLRADVLGSYGHSAGASPNIDRLALQGTRFDRAYTVTPLTIPAHSSLFTGLYPPRHGVRDNGDAFLGQEALTLAERLTRRGYATGAAVGAEVTSHHWGFDQGFDTYRDDLGATAGGNRWAVERPANAVVDDAIDILQARSNQAPWMQWVHVFDVHHPYTPPEPYRSQMQGRAYLGEVAWTDAQLGRLFDAVLARPDADRTWIVLLADHGEGLGAHGENTHGVLLYDPTTRIPLIVRPPNGRAAQVIDSPASIVDVLPTLMAMAGEDPDDSLDGMDLSPLLRGEASQDRSVYIESRYAHNHYGWAPLSALVDPQYKLIHGGSDHLFAPTDRGEANNLSEQEPAGLAEIRGKLDALSAELEASGTGASKTGLTAAQVSQLQALGYVVATTTVDPSKELPDPEDRLGVLADLQRARSAVRDGPSEDDLVLLDALIAQEPGLEEPRFLRISVLLRLDRFDEAVVEAEALDDRRPSSASRRTLGRLRIRQQRVAEGLTMLEDSVDRDPGAAEGWVAWLQMLLRLDRAQELDRVSALAIEARPDDLRISGFRAVSRALNGEAEAVQADLRAALAVDPRAPALRYALGLAHIARGEQQAAESLWREEIDMFPPSLPSRRALVALYASQSRYEQQIIELQVIATHQPNSVDTAHSLAQALFNVKRYPDALAQVERCRALGPGYPACTMLLANVLKKLDRPLEAETAYRRALIEAEAVREP